MTDLEAQFQNAILKLYDDSNKAINYRPTRLMEMSNELGAVQAARQLISKPDDPSSGFMKLWEKGRLDLSVEALILKPEFAPLFTEEEREKARQYLREYKYTAPWDKPESSGTITSTDNGFQTNTSVFDQLQRISQDLGNAAVESDKELENLKEEFAKFQQDPLERLRVKTRQTRAGQLRDLLSKPDGINLDIFNREVWLFESVTYLRGEKLETNIFDDKYNFNLDQIQDFEQALANGELELHGNYMWGTGTAIFDASNNRSDPDGSQRTANIRAALKILNDPALTPMHKAEEILKVRGFGRNLATGLVMILTPNDFAIYNTASQKALENLGYSVSNLQDFEEAVADLKTELGAVDYQELDWFLYRISHDQGVDEEESPEETEPTQEIVATSLEEWQANIEATARSALVRQLAKEFPAWLVKTFGSSITLSPANSAKLGVWLKDKWIMDGYFNAVKSLFVYLHDLTPEEEETLRSGLRSPSAIRPAPKWSQNWKTKVYGFWVLNERDYRALQDTLKLVALRLIGYPALHLYEPAALKKLIEEFRRTYGSFNNPEYLSEERDYKLDAAEKQHNLLGKEQLKALIDQGDYEEIKKRIKQAAYGNNMLNQFDMRPILDAPAESLSLRLYDLLYGEQPFEQRFNAWLEVLKTSRPRCWPSATYYLMLHDPAEHIFIKPEPFREFLEELNSELKWQTRPSPELYGQFQELGRQILPELATLGARDMIDVQSFIWILQDESLKPKDEKMREVAYTILSEANGRPLTLQEILQTARQRGLLDNEVSALDLSSALLRDDRFMELGEGKWGLNVPPEIRKLPEIVAGPDTGFFRVHFPREMWSEARQNSLIAIDWPPDSTNQSVQRFKRIKVGDRIVAYVQNGTIGGIGIVTKAFHIAEAENARLFGGKYRLQIGVSWADTLDQPVSLLGIFQLVTYRDLYNKLKNPNTVVPIDQQDYATILALLNIADIVGAEDTDTSRPTMLTVPLNNYLSFALSLDQKSYTADNLLFEYIEARGRGLTLPYVIDAADLVDNLRQLRLIKSDGDQSYIKQDYVLDNHEAMLRLMGLALLLRVEGSTDTYELPARKIIAFLRKANSPIPTSDFAPELGPDCPRLLSWYSEAGFVEITGDKFSLKEGSLEKLEGDDAAIQMYNQFLQALLSDLDGTLETELEPVNGPLQAVNDLEARLRRLGQRLLINPQIVKRIYRSLIAGRHVVLSGPPGTGKTELAKELPTLLWEEEPHEFVQLPTELDKPPVETKEEQRHGYFPIVVTATEDWGVRDVIGGIGPRLENESKGLSYDYQYGVLTRAVLSNYEGTADGRMLPITQAALQRRDYYDQATKKRYRGAWLVIDEFTRAPVDAAFGSLLTTLSGSAEAKLTVPTVNGDLSLPLPSDFRIIGTLNSFDRHFLNQISEALKRRFDFIDVLPPTPQEAVYEQGVVIKNALKKLRNQGFTQQIKADNSLNNFTLLNVLQVKNQDGVGRPVHEVRNEATEVAETLNSFWRIFEAIRVFRQLGTAQAEAVFTNLFAGVLVGLSWPEALDTALADSLADQLQVLNRDEQRILLAYLDYADDAKQFLEEVQKILGRLPQNRRPVLLRTFYEAEQQRSEDRTGTIATGEDDHKKLSAQQLSRVFNTISKLTLPAASTGVFYNRLSNLMNERGL